METYTCRECGRERTYERRARPRIYCRERDCPSGVSTHRGQQIKAARERLRDAFKDVPCMDCGGRFPPECMDFDHRPGEVKVMELGSIMRRLEDWLAEVEKCDVVCSNCHRIRTRKQRELGLWSQRGPEFKRPVRPVRAARLGNVVVGYSTNISNENSLPGETEIHISNENSFPWKF